MILKHIHANISALNGRIYYFIDDKDLLSIEIATPHFNDYGEWRFREITIVKDYKHEDDGVMCPFMIPDIEITKDEYAVLQYMSDLNDWSDCSDEIIAKTEKYWEKHPEYEQGLVILVNYSDIGLSIVNTVDNKPVPVKEFKIPTDINAPYGLHRIFLPTAIAVYDQWKLFHKAQKILQKDD